MRTTVSPQSKRRPRSGRPGRTTSSRWSHRAYAGIALPNPASVALHEKLDFTQAGIFREVGYKFGRYCDVAWYERDLSS